MSAPSLDDILNKLIIRLQADATLISLFGSNIYNHPPQDIVLPHLRASVSRGAEWGGKDFAGYDGTISVGVWTDQHGDKNVNIAADAVHACLHELPLLLLAPAQMICLHHQDTTITPDSDGVAHSATITFTFQAST